MKKINYKNVSRTLITLAALATLLFTTACGTSSETASAPSGTTLTASAQEPANADAGVPFTGIEITSRDIEVNIAEQGYYVIPVILDQGWFDEVFAPYGITVNVPRFNNGPEMLEAYTAGAIDFAQLGLQPAVSGAANGVDIRTIQLIDDAEKNILLGTIAGSGIESVEDLRGKKIAVTIGSNGHSFLIKRLEEAGLSVEDVQIINIDFNTAATVLEAGEVDASVGYKTIFDNATQDNGTEFSFIADATGLGIAKSILTVNDEFAEAHPDIVLNIVALFGKAIEFIEENPEETIRIASDYYGTDPEIVRNALPVQNYNNHGNNEIADDLKGYIGFMYDNGLITVQVNVEDIYDDSFVKEVGLYEEK